MSIFVRAKDMTTSNTFPAPEILHPTNLHVRLAYLQVRVWLGNNDGIEPALWGGQRNEKTYLNRDAL